MDTRLTDLRKENVVETTIEIQKEIGELGRMPVRQLRQKYLEVFGEESRSNHKQFLFRRIAWRIQANAWGGLSECARRRALEIANDARLPPPGTSLDRHDKRRRLIFRIWTPNSEFDATPADRQRGKGNRYFFFKTTFCLPPASGNALRRTILTPRSRLQVPMFCVAK
jgi:hypothetical protein